MLLLAALLLQATPVEEAPIVAMGRKLEQLSVAVTRSPDGKFSCGLSDSSGDDKIDKALCKVATRCAKQGELASESMETCIDRRKPALLQDYASRARSGAR